MDKLSTSSSKGRFRSDQIIGNQVWRVVGYYDETPMSEEEIPFKSANVTAIIALLSKLTARHLTAQQLEDALAGRNDLFVPRQDADSHHRLTITMGQNPHYSATLLRSEDFSEPVDDALARRRDLVQRR